MEAFSNPVKLGVDIGMKPHVLTPDERRLLRTMSCSMVHGVFEEIFWKLVVTNHDQTVLDRFEVFRTEMAEMSKKKMIVTTDYLIDSGPLQLCKEAARDVFIASVVRRAGIDNLEALVVWASVALGADL
jgi:5'(3')-deoxyribonucleotidase